MNRDRRDQFVLLMKIADGLVLQERHQEALENYRKGLALAEQLASEEPSNANARRDCALVQCQIGQELKILKQLQAAERAFRECCAVLEPISDRPGIFEPLRNTYTGLGQILFESGRGKEALTVFEKALALNERQFASHQDDRTLQKSLINAGGRLADALVALSRFEDAARAFARSLHTLDAIEAKRGADRDLLYDRYVLLGSMAEAVGRAGREREALDLFEKGGIVLERLIAKEPENANLRDEHSNIMFRIGDVLSHLGQRKEGFAVYWKSVQDAQQLAQSGTSNPEWLHNMGKAIERFADRFAAVDDREKAETQYRKSLGISEFLADSMPEKPEWQIDVVVKLLKLADLGSDSRARYQRALEILRRLAAAGKLTAEQAGWASTIQARLHSVRN